jgi:drug/metabolite transporter (DMT)-like permease
MKKTLPYLALLFTAILYGTTYIIIKTVSEDIPVFWVMGFRMGFSLIGFIPFYKKIVQVNLSTIKLAIFIGSVFALGTMVQIYGLKHIDSGKAAFINGLFIILTPFLSWIIYRTKISKKLLIPILIILTGLFFMFYDPHTNFLKVGLGEFYNFLGAISIAFHILFTAKYLKNLNIFSLCFFQLLFIFVFSIVMILITGQEVSLSKISSRNWLLLGYIGIAASTFTFLLQNYGQKYVNETTSAIIISIEPIFATIFGLLFGNELLTWQAILGGSFMFIGFIITIWIESLKNRTVLENKKKDSVTQENKEKEIEI